MSCFLAVRTKNSMTHIKVPIEVYIYVKQLEHAVKSNSKEALSTVYPYRFSGHSLK